MDMIEIDCLWKSSLSYELRVDHNWAMHLQTPFLRDCFVTFWPRMIPFLRLVVIDTFHSYIVYCTVCCVYKVLQSWPGHLLLSVCAHVSWERMDFNGNTPSQGPLLQRTFTTCVCWKHVIIFLSIGVACGFTHKYSGQNKYEITDK